jgi:hypothetical protein
MEDFTEPASSSGCRVPHPNVAQFSALGPALSEVEEVGILTWGIESIEGNRSRANFMNAKGKG